ncbi:delta 9 acyl-lipid fatty acid desaturase [Luteitalea sp. TBR-22]|uniref:acyl-CoA desaturase n=1 Tax=Luteitalea sp. TBR-22 TaxID=2802971 RepID=UPI001AF7A969|nr:acyl-CoA desaturase [Luteitalea sp. TBR-22]BCS34367.1 delta 9 acyl-lipid fatty acid desaturase [Luteitalea sp. TBR-22]
MKKKITASLFWVVQASSLLVLFVPFSAGMLALWAVSHFLRAIGLTLTYHRYFAHRAFRMGRVTQFVWALIGCAAMQKGPLWWAGHHVTHHKFADREGDPHSPIISGFYHAHLGWFLNDMRHDHLPESNPVVRDFGKYRELRLLDEYYWAPPLLMAIALYLYGGLQWLAWGFLLPTMTLAHATFAINTINHLYGSRRFDTVDESRNNPITALFAVGEGWHNNHHRYQRSARNGFYWWEFDPTWYVIKAMSLLGLAWDLQPVPERIYREARERTAARVDPEAAEADA